MFKKQRFFVTLFNHAEKKDVTGKEEKEGNFS